MLFFLSASQTWGVSVSPHQYDAKSVIFSVDAYVYDAPLNLRICDNQCIESKVQDVNKGRFLALVGDFLAAKRTVSKIDDITKPGSKLPNIKTDIPKSEFEKNLL